ncbi:MAG: hypothetical protein BRC31_02870 [Actinobacteria bacterium QS_5_72_10]|nr:MAG: hypothetical protein BRC31_02870 [Actinobacteria bacterium QS_5_72_10]
MLPLTLGLATVATAAMVGVQATTPGLQREHDVQRARQMIQRVVDESPATFVASDVRLAEHGPGGRRTLLGTVYAAGEADRDALAKKIESALLAAPLPVVPLMDVSVLSPPQR